MGVKFKTKTKSKLGLPSFISNLGLVSEYGVFNMSGGELKITLTSVVMKQNGNHVKTVSFPMGLISSIVKGTASETDLMVMKKAVEELIAGHGPINEVHPYLVVNHENEAAAIMAQKAADQIDQDVLNSVKADYGKPVDIDAYNVLKMAPVALASAQHLYQPVTATSENSVYHVCYIDLDKAIKVAARVKGKYLSFRAEGHGLSHCKEALKDAGFSMKHYDKGYVSIHLQVNNDVILTEKTYGAVMYTLAGDTNFGNLGVFKQYGK